MVGGGCQILQGVFGGGVGIYYSYGCFRPKADMGKVNPPSLHQSPIICERHTVCGEFDIVRSRIPSQKNCSTLVMYDDQSRR